MSDLTFAELHKQSVSRRARWHGPGTIPWTGADWSNAMCGEAGEAANVVKKLRRHETGTATASDPSVPVLVGMLAMELADVVAYLDLLADHYGIDLAGAVAVKFNQVSERNGFPERLHVAIEIDDDHSAEARTYQQTPRHNPNIPDCDDRCDGFTPRGYPCRCLCHWKRQETVGEPPC